MLFHRPLAVITRFIPGGRYATAFIYPMFYEELRAQNLTTQPLHSFLDCHRGIARIASRVVERLPPDKLKKALALSGDTFTMRNISKFKKYDPAFTGITNPPSADLTS